MKLSKTWVKCKEKFLALLERKKSLLSEALEDLRKQKFQEIWEHDERIGGEEMELCEKHRIGKKY